LRRAIFLLCLIQCASSFYLRRHCLEHLLHQRLLHTAIPPLQVLSPELRARISRLPPHIRNTLVLEGSERALLNHVLNGACYGRTPLELSLTAFLLNPPCLLTAIFMLDPDVLVGHNIAGFDLDVLLHRIEACKAQLWARLGRLRRSTMPQSNRGSNGRTQYAGVLTAGRLICDTYLAARESQFAALLLCVAAVCVWGGRRAIFQAFTVSFARSFAR
jgi:hypothetical protein